MQVYCRQLGLGLATSLPLTRVSQQKNCFNCNFFYSILDSIQLDFLLALFLYIFVFFIFISSYNFYSIIFIYFIIIIFFCFDMYCVYSNLARSSSSVEMSLSVKLLSKQNTSCSSPCELLLQTLYLLFFFVCEKQPIRDICHTLL